MIAALRIGLAAAAAGLCAAAGAQQALERADEASLGRGGVVEFQRGAFRVDPASGQVLILCIQVQGRWQHIGKGTDCGNPPPAHLRREIERFPDDVTFLGIRNLGVNSEQWREASKKPAGANSVLRRINEAFSYRIEATEVTWRFSSSSLPAELRTPIPGAATAIHFGENYSAAKRPLLFDGGGSLAIETRVALRQAKVSGKAHTGLTVAVDLDVPTAGGERAGLPVIVSLFHPGGKPREGTPSDGRVDFASSYFGPGTKYIVTLEGQQKHAPWNGFERFAFTFTPEGTREILEQVNAKRGKGGKQQFDPARVNEIRISSMTLRNENRFLDRGEVDVEVAVDYLALRRQRR